MLKVIRILDAAEESKSKEVESFRRKEQQRFYRSTDLRIKEIRFKSDILTLETRDLLSLGYLNSWRC